MKKSLILLMALILALVLVSCGGGGETTDSTQDSGTEDTGTTDSGTEDTGKPEETKKDFTGITFDGATLDYDGSEHEIVISGTLPQGASVSYTDNKGTNAGTYNATATITAEGYNTLVLNATLTIKKLNFTGITFDGVTLDYDGSEHEIVISGTLPQDTSVSYTGNKGTNAGTYNASVVISKENYNTLELKAKLVINKIDLNGFSFENQSFEYDGLEHSIVVSGIVPNGVTIDYKGGENGKNGATGVGKHEIVATISGNNYNTMTLKAIITIKTTE